MTKHYHLIGIGGIGMSGIAHLLLAGGAKVSGSDLKENKVIAELKKKGALIYPGHLPENVHGADIVVYSSAIKENNPEVLESRRLNIPLVMRAQALAALMEDKSVIAVAGSHGKTTTTSLVSCLLLGAGLCPTAAIGGILKNIDTNACLGNGKFFVAEADESDGSFLYYKPRYSIVTNIDHEHLDYYKNFQNEVDVFKQFINNTDSAGCVFCCADDLNLMKIVKDYKGKSVLFGLGDNAHIYPKNIFFDGLNSEFDCFYNGKYIERFRLSLGGAHNISNALSVIALGLELGIDLKIIKKTLLEFKGSGRRLDIKLEENGFMIIDDYAHHPTEIQATLKAVENLRPKRLIAIFQPHRYSRTQLLMEEFSRSFKNVDYLIITDIYAASEAPIEGVDARLLADKARKQNISESVSFVPKEELVSYVMKLLRPQDVLITLGAGDIVKVSDELAVRIKNKK